MALVAGAMLLLLGGLLALDAEGVIDFRIGWFAPVACAVAGATLVAAGLSGRR